MIGKQCLKFLRIPEIQEDYSPKVARCLIIQPIVIVNQIKITLIIFFYFWPQKLYLIDGKFLRYFWVILAQWCT